MRISVFLSTCSFDPLNLPLLAVGGKEGHSVLCGPLTSWGGGGGGGGGGGATLLSAVQLIRASGLLMLSLPGS